MNRQERREQLLYIVLATIVIGFGGALMLTGYMGGVIFVIAGAFFVIELSMELHRSITKPTARRRK